MYGSEEGGLKDVDEEERSFRMRSISYVGWSWAVICQQGAAISGLLDRVGVVDGWIKQWIPKQQRT